MQTIQQRDFIEILATKLGITFSDAERYVNTFKYLVYDKLAEGNKINLQGFGQFSVSHRASRLGVNPRTMAKITIPELQTPKFKAGEAFKEAVKLRKL